MMRCNPLTLSTTGGQTLLCDPHANWRRAPSNAGLGPKDRTRSVRRSKRPGRRVKRGRSGASVGKVSVRVRDRGQLSASSPCQQFAKDDLLGSGCGGPAGGFLSGP